MVLAEGLHKQWKVVRMELEAGTVLQLEARIAGEAPDSQTHRTAEVHLVARTGYREKVGILGDHIVGPVERYMVAVEDCMEVGGLDFHIADSGDTLCMVAGVDRLGADMVGPEQERV
jgi:hypothetical protein